LRAQASLRTPRKPVLFSEQPLRRALPSLILLAVISLGSLFFRIGSLPLSGADEPRYARIAQEMHEGLVWVTPRLEGKPWLEKPPLYYWITKPFYSLFSARESAARFGPAVCAFISVLAIFWLGMKLWSTRAGLFGALILLTSLGFAGFGRSASTDMPFTCCFTLAMTIFGAVAIKDIGWKMLVAYAFLGLAVLGKGPVAIILAAGIGLMFWFLDDRGVILRRWHIIPGLIIAAAISVPWFLLVFQENGYSFIATFFINHNLARYVTNIHHHSEPFYYYLPALLVLIFPWSGWLWLLVSKSHWKGFRNWRHWNPGMTFLACWFLFPIVFFSLSDSKLAGYMLPSLPPLALILGVHLSQWTEASVRPRGLRTSMILHLALSAAMAAAAIYFFQKQYGGAWKTGLLLAIAILAPALPAFWFGLRGNYMRAFKTTVIQGLVILVATAQFAFPILGAYHSTRDIARQALELRHSGEPVVTYRFFHHSLHYYTSYQIADELKDLESLRQYAETHHSFLAVTKAQELKTLSGSMDLSIIQIGTQGSFRLLRISPK
jgi:4-amino-4-deoxy-L-arabinose transferase-like glycosyltransferase